MENTISILIPCLNENKYIADCLSSAQRFVIPASVSIEVLVLDGGSTDGTRDIVREFAARDSRFKLVPNPGKIQSTGLNIGIRMSKGEWIMRLDAHTHYPADYLRCCYATALASGADNVGGLCITHPGGDGYQAQLVQAVTTHRFGVGNSGFRTSAKAGPRDTVPFGFFRRSVFERIGLFDERLVRTQDYELNQRLRSQGGSIYLNPEITSSYFNQPTLGAFLKKQLFKQGPYNAYLWYLAPYAFVTRHAVTVCFGAFFWTGLLLSLASPLASSVYLSVFCVYFALALLSSLQQARRYRSWRHVACLPFTFFLFHLCHGSGVLVGLLKVATGTAPVQKASEPWEGAGSAAPRLKRQAV